MFETAEITDFTHLVTCTYSVYIGFRSERHPHGSSSQGGALLVAYKAAPRCSEHDVTVTNSIELNSMTADRTRRRRSATHACTLWTDHDDVTSYYGVTGSGVGEQGPPRHRAAAEADVTRAEVDPVRQDLERVRGRRYRR